MLAGALLAFALSFDEVIVTIFLAGRASRRSRSGSSRASVSPTRCALVNVAGLVAILLSVVPVYLATRLTRDTGPTGRT